MKVNLQLPYGGKKNRFSFSSNHETTLNFGSIIPCYSKDLAPNEDLSVFTRFAANVAPMLVPTFGDVRVRFHSYFVPYSSVWDYFNDFIVGKVSPSPNGTLGSFVQFDDVPLIANSQFIRLFVQGNGLVASGSSSNYDIAVPYTPDGGSSSITYHRFTRRGKVAYQILQSLGYNIDFSIGIRDGSQGDPNRIVYNALPLLAFCKLFFENFMPQQYKVNNKWRNFQQYLHDAVPNNSGLIYIDQQYLNDLMDNFVLYYTQDYFTAMWNNPNMLSPGLVDVDQQYYAVPDPAKSDPSSEVVSVSQTDGITMPSVDASDAASPWTMRLAEKIQGWITRNNLAGSDYVNRILANFGVKPVERLGIVQFCGDYETQLKIDSVFDTAGVDGKPLASYAGRGFIREKLPYFKCSVKEHGMFFIVATVQPLATFTDGVDRHLLYKDRFDFFTPDFDGLAMQGTPVCEVFNSFTNGDSVSLSAKSSFGFNNPLRIIGFNPRYAERKFEKCRVTGDFNIRSVASSVAPYSLQRYVFVDKFDLSRGLANGRNEELVLSDLIYQSDVSQYNRIFADTTGLPDPIFALFDFRTTLISPMKQLGDSFTQFNEGNKTISVEKNGGFTN